MNDLRQFQSIGSSDWIIQCAEGEVAVQSIFLRANSQRLSDLRVLPDGSGSFSRGKFVVPLSFLPEKSSIEHLMIWAIQDTRLSDLTDTNARELVKIAEELGFNGLTQACDLYLQNQARAGKLFGPLRQSKEQSQSPEFTREFWDSFANKHKLGRLAACCEAYHDYPFSEERPKRAPSGFMRRLSDASWTSGISEHRVSVDG